MATTIKNTEMIFDNDKSFDSFMDRLFSNDRSNKNKALKETSKNIKEITKLRINGEIVEVSK
ncbi:hypothetical protein ACWOAH_11265 [Vagococcus vulneris]|uniref:Uncharacterized protein n=1 Tax=Vagococcus vulneris TaxID=1977869 RepID=A0A429ZQR9_9ENTE|nr:hypothetical protein [Vagococcus vulneris]RST96015.1 hypothetical protein CBF37_11260 [Vagococcus vulneris]